MNSKFVLLESERLTIRQAHANDALSISEYFTKNREFHKQFDPIRPDEFFTELYWEKLIKFDFIKLKNDTSLRLFIFHNEYPTKVIGMIHFSEIIRGVFQACYLAYSLAEKNQGNGYMHEALTHAIEFVCDELRIHRIMANYMVSNTKSKNVLQQLNFDIEGTAKDYLYINGNWEDHVLTSYTNKEHSFNQ